MMKRNTYTKLYTWCDDLAYIVGLITADGSLSKDGRHIDVTSKDSEIMSHVTAILKLKTKTSSKLGGFKTYAYSLQFSDVALYDFLLAVGLTPAKSKIMRLLSVPDAQYAHFLRGYFDGDGTTYSYTDPYFGSQKYYIAFASGSKAFLEWVQVTNKRLLSTQGGAINIATRAFQLVYGKSDAQVLYRAMYEHTSNFPKLTRKWEALRGFILADPYGKIPINARVL